MPMFLFWSDQVKVEIDSVNVRQALLDTEHLYHFLYNQIVNGEGSPYKGSLSLQEFLWAFSIVGSRHLILNNDVDGMFKDPNLILILAQLFDFINHSNNPNVVALPYHDKVSEQSFISLSAAREIETGEQLFLSYGNLSNMHFIQKYGFTVKENPNNSISSSANFFDYQNVVSEERKLKEDISANLGLPMAAKQFAA